MKLLRITAIAAMLLCLFQAAGVHAHAVGENYAFLDIMDTAIEVRLELNERELQSQFGLSLTGVKPPPLEQLGEVLDYVEGHFSIRVGEQRLPLAIETAELLVLPQGRFLQLHYAAPWPGPLPHALTITQELFFDLDKRHRGLVMIDYNAVTGEQAGWENTALVFGPHNATQELNLVDVPGLSGRLDFLLQGTWHILIGYDHILFLLTLLLTAVLVRVGGSWQAEPSFRRSFLNVAAIVTIFTVAHSVTLTLAALGWVSVSSQLVESVIALSIIVMAMNNLRPFLPNRWIVIFLFGLFHGLGFATVMEHLSFRMVDLVTVMVLFNIGVELGQLMIVAIIFPILFTIRNRNWYVPVVLRGGSTVIALIATFWLAQRLIG